MLETNFETADTSLTVTDFLPPVADDEDRQHRALYRQVTCDSGPVQVEVEFQPRFDYARAETELAPIDGGLASSIVYLNYVHGQELDSDPLGVRLGSGGILDER